MSDETRAWKDQYMLRFPEGMREQLKNAAGANGRSLNAEIIHRMTNVEYYEQELAFLTGQVEKLEKKLKDAATGDLDDLFIEALPWRLFTRIELAAKRTGRDFLDEIKAALLEAYPPPPPISLDRIYEEYVKEIVASPPSERQPLLDKANLALSEMGIDEVRLWLSNDGDQPRVFWGERAREE